MDDSIREYFSRDTLAKHLGIALVEYRAGYARCEMRVGEHHLNGLGTALGGAIFSLADFAFAVACNSHGTVAVGVNTSMAFVNAAFPGMLLTAEAREESCSPRIGAYAVHVTSDTGDLVAIFHGMSYRKKQLIADVVQDRPAEAGK